MRKGKEKVEMVYFDVLWQNIFHSINILFADHLKKNNKIEVIANALKW